jgi:amino acid transporter
MSAVHAGDVSQPQKNYPKAILYSALAVIIFPLLGVLSILIVVPKSQLTLNAGCLQAFEFFLKSYNLSFLLPLAALIIAFGAVGSLSTWLLGPCKGLLASAQTGDLPAMFKKTNKNGVPYNLLITQAVIVSLLSLLFVWMPSVNTAYWILLVLTTQLYLLMYLILFPAAIKLRYKYPNLRRPFRVPGGVTGLWVMGTLGFVSSFVSFIIGFFPPSHLSGGSSFGYWGFLAGAIVILTLIPSLILKLTKIEVEHVGH